MSAVVIDDKKYARVLATVLPQVIVSEKENARMLVEAEKLMGKGENRTHEEDAVLDLTVHLIKDYESKEHSLPNPSTH